MPESSNILSQMEKLIRKNVVMHFASKPNSEKTLENVEAFAKKQLDFFMAEVMKNNPGLQRGWKNGHPFVARAAINKETLSFEIQIVEREPGKY
jgi:hypothetical protein